MCLEKDFDKNKNEIGYLYYLLGYYTGMFYHPANGKDIGLSFLKKALTITNDDTVLEEILVTITGIAPESPYRACPASAVG